jgi:hypothetical protein
MRISLLLFMERPPATVRAPQVALQNWFPTKRALELLAGIDVLDVVRANQLEPPGFELPPALPPHEFSDASVTWLDHVFILTVVLDAGLDFLAIPTWIAHIDLIVNGGRTPPLK